MDHYADNACNAAYSRTHSQPHVAYRVLSHSFSPPPTGADTMCAIVYLLTGTHTRIKTTRVSLLSLATMKRISPPPSAPHSKKTRSSKSSLPSPLTMKLRRRVDPLQVAPSVTIDHSAFPHLLDLILLMAPRASLLPLRATSKANHRACDLLLSQHLHFTANGIEHPEGRHPAFMEINTQILYQHCVLSQRALQRPMYLLSATQVLDIRHPVGVALSPILGSLRPSFGRLYGWGWDPRIAVPPSVFVHHGELDHLEGVKRVLVPAEGLSRVHRFPESLEEMVIVFRGRGGVGEAVRSITKHVANYAWGGRTEVRFTVVNLPEEEESDEGEEGEEAMEIGEIDEDGIGVGEMDGEGEEESEDSEEEEEEHHKTHREFRRAIARGITRGEGPDVEILNTWKFTRPWRDDEAKAIAGDVEFLTASGVEERVGRREWELCELVE